MAKKHHGKHTGPIHHDDMVSRLKPHGKKDPHASPEYHKMNAEHGMPDGMHPADGSDATGMGEGGGEGMSGNVECC